MPARPKVDPIDKFLADLALGRHDDRLADLVEAIGSHAVAKRAQVCWRVTTPDFTVTVEDCTLNELERMEHLTGSTWHTLGPQRSAAHCRAVLQALYESRCSLSAEDATAKAGSFTRRELDTEVVSDYLAVPAPFENRSPSTS